VYPFSLAGTVTALACSIRNNGHKVLTDSSEYLSPLIFAERATEWDTSKPGGFWSALIIAP